MNRDCSEAGNGLVLVRIENTVFLRTAIAIEHLREADACILVLCSSHIVCVILADLVSAVHEQCVRVTHPLLICSKDDGVEDLVE